MSERHFELPLGTTAITPDAASARQWEAFLMRTAVKAGVRAWRTPRLLGYRSWLAESWSADPRADPVLLPAQSRALWQRVIDASPERRELISVAGPAAWAAEAWSLLARWRIDPAALRAAHDQPDFGAFLGWLRSYRSELEAHGWRDAVTLEEAPLPAAQMERLLLADHDDALPPAAAALLERLAARGTEIERWSAPRVGVRRERVAAEDPDEELALAVEWAAARLRAAPEARIALVLANLREQRSRLERVLPQALGEVRWWDPGRAALRDDPAIGTALTAIELVWSNAGFTAFSRWLRSPPLGDPRSGPWARLESGLRSGPLAQLDFIDAYRHGGLQPLLREAAPELAAALAAALREAAENQTERRTPSAWAAVWQRGLRVLGWPLAPLTHDTEHAWEAALAELRRLTPVLGAITAPAALDELDRIVAAQRLPAPLPARGVFLFERVEDVGPGYDAAWLTGFTTAEWPRPPRLNPLLPRALQHAHGMPWSSPRDALERSERALARLFERVPEVIVSWPKQVLEHAAEPSPLLRSLPEREPIAGRPRHAPPLELERVADPPPPLPGAAVRGGAGALNAQARAPLRAFCQYRLGARELEPLTLGLSSRLRGIATHRALELAYAPAAGGGSAAAAALDLGTERLAACAADALRQTFGAAGRRLGALFRLELERLTALLDRLAAAEAARPPFAVELVERRAEIALGGKTLRVRIDRVDRLADGSLAVLDYKTGRANAGDWQKERLREAQVPLYAVHLGFDVTAAVLVALDPAAVAYQGVWQDTAFPGRARRPHADSWAAQLELWRTQLEALALELAGGDCRVFVADLELVAGAYAPLTRICEQLALHRVQTGF